MNIASDIKTYVTTQITDLYATLLLDNFGDTSNSIMLRRDPSVAMEKEFIDGSITGQQQIAFYAKSKTPATAINALDEILALFNDPDITLNDALCMSVSPLSTVAFVSKESTGESIYTCSVMVKYDWQNPAE